MKKVVLMCCAMAALVFASCDNGDNGSYEGINYVEISSVVNSIYDVEDGKQFVVNVYLTKSLENDLVLGFAEKSGKETMTFINNPVTIPAGQKNGTFSLVLADNLNLEADEEFVVTLSSKTLPDKVQFKEDLTISIKTTSNATLTEEQQAIIDAYTAVDLSKYLGAVRCSVEYTYYDMATSELCETPKTWETISVITLSEEATSGAPVLKMVANPMGMENEMYNILKGQTIENEYWPEQPDGMTLMTGINWNTNGHEVFSMTLDGITLGADGAVEFVGELPDRYEDPYPSVPFEYYFSAYERELKTVLDVTEDGTGTANPAFWLAPYSDITVDEWENEDGVFVEPSASISAESLTFEYCFDYDGAFGYNKVKVTYTPNE